MTTSVNLTRAVLAPYDARAADNAIINGKIDVSQQLGTTGLTLTTNTVDYTSADMVISKYKAGTAVVTAAQLAAASFPANPTYQGYKFGHQIKATTKFPAQGSLSDGDFCRHGFPIEGYRIAHWGWGAANAQSVWLALMWDTTNAGVGFIKLSNNDQSRCYYQEVTQVAGWNFQVFRIPGDTGGTWQATTNVGLYVEVYPVGKNTTPAATSSGVLTWSSTDKVATTNSTSLLSTTNNDVSIVTGVFIAPCTEKPTEALLPTLMLPFDQEVMRCMRYYEKSYNYSMAPGTGADGTGLILGIAVDTTRTSFIAPYKVPKRAAPTITLYSYNGTSGVLATLAANTDTASASPTVAGLNGFAWVTSSGLTAGAGYHGYFVASARLP